MQIRSVALKDSFRPGDLLYGLKAYRKAAQALIKDQSAGLPTIADEYNAFFITQLTDLGLADFVKNADYQATYQQLSDHFKAHLYHLENASVEKVRISNNAGHTLSYGKIIKRLDMEQRRTRRACKAALLRPDITKHFLLDGINPVAVFDRASNLRCHYDSYTSAELRFLLRFFDQTKNIVFYYHAKPVSIISWLEKNNALGLYVHYIESKRASRAKDCLFKQEENRASLPMMDIEASPFAFAPVDLPPPTPKKSKPPQQQNKRKRARRYQPAAFVWLLKPGQH